MPNIFHIERGEGPKVLSLFSYLFFVVGVGIVGKAARDSYFLSRYDRSLLPVMLVACAVAVVLAVTAYARLAKWLGERVLFYASNGAFLISLLLISLRLEGGFIPVLYVWMDVIGEITGMQFWMLASNVFDPRQAKRLLGPIGAGGALAGVVFGLGLRPFVRAFGSGSLLYFAAAMLAISWLLALIAGRYALRTTKASKPITAHPAKTKRRLDPYLASIALVISLSAIEGLLVDYQFKMIAARSFATEGGMASFFGQFYAFTGAASLVVQLVLSSFILSRYGVLAGMLILPVLVNLGSIALILRTSLASALFTKSSDQIVKSTLQRSAGELLWLPVPPQRRQTAKPLITSSVKSTSEGMAGLATFFLVKVMPLQYLSAIVIFATAGWIVAAFRLKSLYVKALARAIEKHQIDFEELTVDVKDPAMVSVIRRALESGDAVQQIFVLDLISTLSLEPWAATLQQLLREGSVEVRQRILALAGRDRSVVPDAALEALIREPDGAGAEAILAIGERQIDRLLPELTALLAGPSAATRLAAAAVILRWRKGPAERARSMLAAALESADAHERATALRLLAEDARMLSPARLRDCLESESPIVRDAALNVTARRADATLIPAVVDRLESPATAPHARRVLKSFAAHDVLECLAAGLRDTRLALPRKIAIVRALRDYPDGAAVDLLLRAIERDSVPLAVEIADALLAIARAGALPDDTVARLEPDRQYLIRRAYLHNRALCLLPDDADAFLLRESSETAIARIVPLVLKLGAIGKPDAPIETCIRIVQAKEAGRMPFVLEFLESVFPRAERPLVYPLLEPIPPATRDREATDRFSDLPAGLDQLLAEAACSRDEWRSAIAVDYLSRQDRAALERLDWARVPDSALLREIKARREKEPYTAMYSTLEKTIFLKSVDLFGRIPAETLSRIARVTEERQIPAGAAIFHDGDPGGSMFIVVDGAVEIHKGGRELSLLKKGACFGEMSLLDAAPRSADATAREESTLFEIGEESFYEVLSGHVEIAQGIIRLLAERLRDANRKLADVKP